MVWVRPGGANADSGGGGARKSIKNSFVFFSPLALFFVSPPSPFPSPLLVAVLELERNDGKWEEKRNGRGKRRRKEIRAF